MSAFVQGLKYGFVQGTVNNLCGFSGFMGNPFCCNSLYSFNSFNRYPLFITPCHNFNIFYPYNASPSQIDFPPININIPTPSWNSFPFAQAYNGFFMPEMQYSWGNFGDTFTFSAITAKKSASLSENTYKYASKPASKTKSSSDDFDIMMNFIREIEGGYNPNDCGESGNVGIRQSTYDYYREKRGLPKQAVINITSEEVRKCYYEDFYLASGADKISDKKLAMQVFDAAVNMGVGTAKILYEASGDDLEKFIRLRKEEYKAIAAKNKDKEKYLPVWDERVDKAYRFANNNLMA